MRIESGITHTRYIWSQYMIIFIYLFIHKNTFMSDLSYVYTKLNTLYSSRNNIVNNNKSMLSLPVYNVYICVYNVYICFVHSLVYIRCTVRQIIIIILFNFMLTIIILIYFNLLFSTILFITVISIDLLYRCIL